MPDSADKQGTLLIFWDYDTQWGADRSRSGGGPKSWGALEFDCTDELLDLHAQYEVPACFAVVGAAAQAGSRPYHDPGQIRQIHAQGHEIGSHAYQHEWLPGLDRVRLRKTLRDSKAALEQCIGAPVTTFVPPYNQPFDYPRGFSFSFSERREAGRNRTDLGQLCKVLAESGYTLCRVAYRPIYIQAAERMIGRRIDRPGRVSNIEGVSCVRLNTPGGFNSSSLQMLERCADRGGMAVVYGHPHSLHSGNSQDRTHLVRFLERVQTLKKSGRLCVKRPTELTAPAHTTELLDHAYGR